MLEEEELVEEDEILELLVVCDVEELELEDVVCEVELLLEVCELEEVLEEDEVLELLVVCEVELLLVV